MRAWSPGLSRHPEPNGLFPCTKLCRADGHVGELAFKPTGLGTRHKRSGDRLAGRTAGPTAGEVGLLGVLLGKTS